MHRFGHRSITACGSATSTRLESIYVQTPNLLVYDTTRMPQMLKGKLVCFLDVARPRQAIGQAERREASGRRPRGGRWEEAAHRQGTSDVFQVAMFMFVMFDVADVQVKSKSAWNQ
eukprot:1191277-Prorocentrum_minimum.AAC.8